MPNGSTGRRSRARLPLVATTLALVTTLTSCSLLGGSDDEPESTSKDKGGLEKTSIQVSIMKTTDLAPFHLAVEKGYFEDEGLKVTSVDAKSGGESTQKLVAGEVDIAYSSYTPFFLAESKGAAHHHVGSGPGHLLTPEQHGAAPGLDEAGERVEQCALARAVAAEQGDDGALAHRERYVAQHLRHVVPDAKVAYVQHRSAFQGRLRSQQRSGGSHRGGRRRSSGRN